MFWLTARRGATDPVCGMKIDREKALSREIAGRRVYFCSEHCLHEYERTGNDAPVARRLFTRPSHGH